VVLGLPAKKNAGCPKAPLDFPLVMVTKLIYKYNIFPVLKNSSMSSMGRWWILTATIIGLSLGKEE